LTVPPRPGAKKPDDDAKDEKKKEAKPSDTPKPAMPSSAAPTVKPGSPTKTADKGKSEKKKDDKKTSPRSGLPSPSNRPPSKPSSRPGLPGARPGGSSSPGRASRPSRTFGPSKPPSFGQSRPAPKPKAAEEEKEDDEDEGPKFDDLAYKDPLDDAIEVDKKGDDKPEKDESKNSAKPGLPSATSPRPGLPSRPASAAPAVKPAEKSEAASKPASPRPGLPKGADSPEKKEEPPAGKADTSKNDAPKAATSKVEEPKTGTPKADEPKTDAPATAKPEANKAEQKPEGPKKDEKPQAKKEPEEPKKKPGQPPKVEREEDEPDREWERPDAKEVLNERSKNDISDDELRSRAEIIEQTLSSFGAPGRVVEVNHGPVITQFGVEPDYIDGRGGKRKKVKVGKISSLADDIALALAAPAIRIEAPVPGKGYVGIEVPNAEPSIVGLRDVIDTPEFRAIDSPLRLALGQDVSGGPIVADLTTMPHLLIAGTTGSGKSVCVNGIISTLLMTRTPDELKFIMVDPKRVELTNYNGIPHLMSPVVTELERIVGVLKWVQREMDDRYRKFATVGSRNIVDYNERIERGQVKDDRLPYILVIIDELADLMMLAPDETEKLITRLAQMARATGIHLIISTQRPSVDVVTGLIKANFPARIAFAVATGVDSRVIMDMPGAEKLLGRGDMLFQPPDAPMPIRMQGVYLSDREIERIVDHWRKQRIEMGMPEPKAILTAGAGSSSARYSSSSNGPVQRSLFKDDDDDDTDDLYDEAVELVQDMGKASISLLQRHLRIGYTRAARLIDMMEEEDIVGPHEGGSKPREVIDEEEEEGENADKK
jgi:S-DNA-T family DNA segregation ATPase FtsK/SpoIIIE